MVLTICLLTSYKLLYQKNNLQGYACFKDSNFAIAFLFVVYEFTACYFDNIINETFASLFHRFVFYNYTSVEVNPSRGFSPYTNPKDWNSIPCSSLSATGNWRMRPITNLYGVPRKQHHSTRWIFSLSTTPPKWQNLFMETTTCKSVSNFG